MIIEEKINGMIFVEQRTYFIYIDEAERALDNPSLTSAREKPFIDNKNIQRKAAGLPPINKYEGYLLKDVDGTFIGVDTNTGGYPFRTDSIGGAKIFATTEDAEKYAQMFKEKGFSVFGIPSNLDKIS